jgi:ABC-type polysaccharide/polyol phosphate export permease
MTQALTDLLRYRQLLWSLTWRDICARYRQSALGLGWAVLMPLGMMLIFTFVFTRAIDAGAVGGPGVPYSLYAFAGLVPWTLFASSLSGCVNCLVANRSLVTKVYFPREVFPLSSVAGATVDFAVASVVLAALMAWFHGGTWRFVPSAGLWLLPVIFAIQTMLTIGLGMLLAMANLFYRDVRQVFSAGVQLLMFVSGVVVPVPTDGLLGIMLGLNPIVPLIAAYRDILLHGRMPAAGALWQSAAVAAVMLVAGWVAFRRSAHRFAECI